MVEWCGIFLHVLKILNIYLIFVYNVYNDSTKRYGLNANRCDDFQFKTIHTR